MYNTNYKCVKPFDVWLDAIGQDGKKIPYRVKRGTIWRLVWCGGEQSFKEFTGPDKMHITLLEAYTTKERSVLDCAEEMADVMEVLYAMGKTCAVSKREIEQVRSQKAAEKGTFSKKIFLVSTEK